jgi:hypothetical protein
MDYNDDRSCSVRVESGNQAVYQPPLKEVMSGTGNHLDRERNGCTWVMVHGHPLYPCLFVRFVVSVCGEGRRTSGVVIVNVMSSDADHFYSP